MTEWAKSYFEFGYAQRFTLGPPSRKTSQDVEGLWELLALMSECSVLDVGCGHGRYAVALRQRGAHVTGLDFSPALLGRAQRMAAECGANAYWVRGDMRQLPFRTAHFKAAVLLDAFGFFDQEEEHDITLNEVARVLEPGGRAVLKVVNAEPILADFQAVGREEHDGMIVEISRRLTYDPLRLIESVSITGESEAGSYERHQRLYRASELCAALKRAGFAVAGLFSSFSGEPFDEASSAGIFVVGERPAQTA